MEGRSVVAIGAQVIGEAIKIIFEFERTSQGVDWTGLPSYLGHGQNWKV